MYWKLRFEKCDGGYEGDDAGRFVLHRHRDADGAHLDLRLEAGEALTGFRIEGDGDVAACLQGTVAATTKGAHPLHWLEQDGDAVPVLRGRYAVVSRDAARVDLRLEAEEGVYVVHAERMAGPDAGCVCAMRAVLDAAGAGFGDAAGLLRDGLAARERAVGRLIGLGRELDGSAFEEGVWRAALAGVDLDAIHAQLRGYEVRFDAKYPPLPTSRPSRLDERGDGVGDALALLRE